MSMPIIDSHRPPPPPATRTSGKAIWSLILGVSSVVCVFFTGLPAILVGLVALGEIGRSQGKLTGRGLAIAGMVIGTLGCLLGVVSVIQAYLAVRQVNQVMLSKNNLLQIGIAVHNYHDVFLALPLTGSEDPELGLNMSWRVRILPYIEQQPMHDVVNYNEPWDSPTNAALLAKMPRLYAVPPTQGGHETSYLAFSAPEPIQTETMRGFPFFGNGIGRGQGVGDFAAVRDGTTNTIMIVEADRDRSVPWMKPVDLAVDPANPKAGLGHVRPGGFIVVMGDASVKFISNKVADDTLLKLILRDDNHAVSVEDALRP